jgi:glycosyltransferase involved in cell wall biosynthesis
MRILWLSPWLRPLARIYAENLLALGAEVMLVTADLHPESDKALDYETVLVGRPVPTADWLKIAKAYRAAKRFDPDVVVTELLRDPRWRIFGGLAPRISLLHDDKPHDETHAERWWVRSFEPWYMRADATIVFSQYVAERLRERGPAVSPIYVAPLATDLHSSAVPDFVPAHRRKNFVLIGRQRPYKNHQIVFAAWEAHTNGSAWKGDELILLGEGDISPELPAHARWIRGDYKYSEVVAEVARAKGSLVHLRSASQSGVHVMSMQLGVPPLVSAVGALPEYQPPGLSVTGIDDVGGLSRAIDELADPAEVEVQGRIALSHYKSHYSAPLAARRLIEIFDDVAGRS